MKHLFTMAFLLAGVMLSAQTQMERQVIAAQGASERTERIRVDWTLGEPAVSTFVTPSGYWTEGFQQPVLRVETVAPATPVMMAYNIRVAPNPTSDRLWVRFPQNLEEEVLWELFDLQGKSLRRQSLPSPADLEIDLGGFSNGTYLLRFSTRQGDLLHTSRIVKSR